MNNSHFKQVDFPRGNISIIWFAAVFALVTYAAVSTRAVLSPFEVNQFIDAKRFFSVVIGTLILWLSIRAVERRADEGSGAQIVAMLNIAIPGAMCLLLAREGYDLAMSGEFAERAALNLRWMLTWIGYFVAAVASFLALTYYRQLQAIENEDIDFDRVLPSTERQPSKQPYYEVADLDFDPRTKR